MRIFGGDPDGRGWDIEPADEETNIAYSILLNEYN